MKSEKPMIKRFAPLIITLIVLALLLAVIVPTVAYYLINANDEGSDYIPFEPGDPSFNLDFNNKEMKNVSIAVEDKGYPVYVRVAIIISWKKIAECTNAGACDCANCTECLSKTDGSDSEMDCPKCNGEDEVYIFPPVKDVDYTIDFNRTGWELIGDYYYCTSPVASGKSTGVLINSCALIDGGGVGVPDGYVLSVEIIVQTVQAVGSTDDGDVPAFRDAWNISEE